MVADKTKDKKANPRRGRMSTEDGDGPAVFEGDAPAVPADGFDPAAVAEDLNLWWVAGAGDKYLMEMDSGDWVDWGERKVLKKMRLMPGRLISLKTRDGERLCEGDRVLMEVMENRRVADVMAGLAGYHAGIHKIAGDRVVIRKSPKLVVPEEGEWDTVRSLIEGLLGKGEGTGHDQVPYFHGWMKMAVEALYNGGPGNFRPGQACIFAGAADSGKSRIQHQIVTGLLGGRVADPGKYMFGKTDHNGELLESEHLLMEDPPSSILTKDRVYFGEMIKGIVVNDTQRLRRMREEAATVSPFWRLTISLNDDPDKMRVLPLLTPDMKDKIMLFHVSKAEVLAEVDTLAERKAFRDKIDAELPAYAWWLMNQHEIAEELKSTRYGVKYWLHPGLATDLFNDTPPAELLMLIDAAVFVRGADKYKLWELPEALNVMKGGKVWQGTALDLARLMEGKMLGWECSVESEARKLFSYNKCSVLLGRLKEDQGERVAPGRDNKSRWWCISRPIEPIS